jgi:secreted trypsin-like serine protease
MVTDADAFGCHRLDEMVSVDFANPCYGDSGGPAYLSVNGDLYLAGVISRLTRRTAADKELCSGGCIYTRIDRFEDWIRRKAGEKGGHMPTPAATPADAAPGKGPP